RDNAISLIDSLNRGVPTRLADCGYQDPNAYESLVKVGSSSPVNAFNIWQYYNNMQIWPIIYYGSQYTVGGLGRGYNPNSTLPYFWVLDVGTLPDAGSTTSTTPTTKKGRR